MERDAVVVENKSRVHKQKVYLVYRTKDDPMAVSKLIDLYLDYEQAQDKVDDLNSDDLDYLFYLKEKEIADK